MPITAANDATVEPRQSSDDPSGSFPFLGRAVATAVVERSHRSSERRQHAAPVHETAHARPDV
jgi:hypothetical protein